MFLEDSVLISQAGMLGKWGLHWFSIAAITDYDKFSGLKQHILMVQVCRLEV